MARCYWNGFAAVPHRTAVRNVRTMATGGKPGVDRMAALIDRHRVAASLKHLGATREHHPSRWAQHFFRP